MITPSKDSFIVVRTSAKMHQNPFGGWAPPGPARGAYSAPQTPYLDFGGGAPEADKVGKGGSRT